MFNKYREEDLKLLKEIYKDNFNEVLEKINNNYPIQYLIGYVNFLDYKINVDERVLIPRFETEYLVIDTYNLIKKHISNPNIIDICTGSGCIAISLSRLLNLSVDALDISLDAIELAKKNAKENQADINFINKDIYNFESNKKYNVLISNPPYIKEDEYLSEETKYEPQIALLAKNQGLEFYDIILRKSKSFLEEKNIIAFEIGDTLNKNIISLVKEYYPKSNIILKKDLNNFNRYIYIINE